MKRKIVCIRTIAIATLICLGGLGMVQAGPNNPPSKVFLFARGNDKAIWYNIFDGTNWQGWEALGGVIRGGPDACSPDDKQLIVFARGLGGPGDGTLFYKKLTYGKKPESWVSFHTKVGSDPTAACRSFGDFDVFAQSLDSPGVWHAWYENKTWANLFSDPNPGNVMFPSPGIGGKSIGGGIYGGPDACSWSGKRLDVFARGAGNYIHHKGRNDDGVWGEWESLGGLPMTSDPSAAARFKGEMTVFARGTNNKLWMKSYSMESDRWSPWFPIGGMDIVGSPDVTATKSGRIDIFARGADNAIWHTSIMFKYNIPDLKNIPAWESLGGAFTSDPSAVAVNW
jgi:hypothetical protein